MRSINVKRVAAVATGAALVGAAAAAAVTTDSTGLESFPFYSGPEPNVKIVVGSASQASDGVNAANIAAMIGNLAYDSTEIEVLNTDMLSCGEGSGEGGSATCTAMVKTPTVNTASAYLMETYVEDKLDNNADTTRSTANTFNGPGSTDYAKLVTQDHTNVLSMPNDGEVDNAKNLDIKQEQRVYVGAHTWYDSTTGYQQVRAKDVRAIYETTFNNLLPACWDTTKTYANCDTSSDQLDRTHTKINFLGDQWVVVSFTLSGGRFTNIKLGKEVSYNPVMNTGDEITAHNGVKVVLDGLSGFGYGTNTEPKATFLIYDENDVNIDTAILQPGDEYKGNGIFLHVYDATSTTGGADYVEVSIFSDTLDLTHGSSVSGHGNWKTYLNGQTGTAQTYGTTEALQSIMLYDDISNNQLNAGESIDLITNSAGFKLNFRGLEEVDYDNLNLNFQKNTQITLGPSNYLAGDMILVGSSRSNAFKFENDAVSTENVRVIASAATLPSTAITYGKFWHNNTWDGGIGQQTTTGIYDAALMLSCNTTNATYSRMFTVTYTDADGTTSQTAYPILQPSQNTTIFAPLNGVTNVTNVQVGNASITSTNVDCVVKSGNIPVGTTFYYKSTDSTMPYHVGSNFTTYDNGTTSTVTQSGNLTNYWYSTTERAMLAYSDAAGAGLYIGVPELTEDNVGLQSSVYNHRYWSALYDQTLQQFVNAVASTTIDKVGYETTAGAAFGTTAPNQEVPYVSYRGSKLAGVSSSSISIDYAVKIAHGQYTLTSGESEGTGLEDERTAGVGEYLLDSDGYSVEVTQVGGENGGICELTGVENLEPSLDQAYEVAEIDASANPVVVLDSSSMASAGSRVIVGGPMVNSVAAEVLSGTTINPGDAMVKVVGSDVVVVGYSASDTTGAANALIDWLSDNRDNVVR